jgi:hypothetical protein
MTHYEIKLDNKKIQLLMSTYSTFISLTTIIIINILNKLMQIIRVKVSLKS